MSESNALPEKIEDYALSVLLHDIGKFWERSSEAPHPSPAELHVHCPQRSSRGDFSHSHAALSARFIEDLVGIPGAARWGPKHHRPDLSSREELCAHLADLLALGETSPDDSRDSSEAASVSLRCVICPTGEQRNLPLTRLDRPDSSLPLAVAPVSREDYRFYWNHFLSAIDRVGGSPLVDLDTWYALLQNFTSRIPAATTSRQLKAIPDVDLFTHSRLVAALAVALYRSPLTAEELQQPDPEASPLALVGGRMECAVDASGSLSPRGIALDRLTDTVAKGLAGKLDLPVTSILQAGGTGFVLLAPLSKDLQSVADEMDESVERETAGVVGLEVASVDLKLVDFHTGLCPSWLSLQDRLQEASRGRTARLSRARYERVFGSRPDDEAGDGEEQLSTSKELVLRLEVEGVDRFIGEEIPREGASLARILVLISTLRQFLDGWIRVKLEKNGLVLLQAGGNTVVLGGECSRLMDVARDFRQAFRRACGHPALSILGGLGGRGEGHGEPKGDRQRDGSRDVFAFLDTVMDFEDLEKLREAARWILSLHEFDRTGTFLPPVVPSLSGRDGTGKLPALLPGEVAEALSWERLQAKLESSGSMREETSRLEWLQGWLRGGASRILDTRMRALLWQISLLEGDGN